MQIAYQVNIFSSLAAAAAAANCCDAVSDKLYLESCLVRLSISSSREILHTTYSTFSRLANQFGHAKSSERSCTSDDLWSIELARVCSRLVPAIKLIDMGKTVNCMKRAWKTACLSICQGDNTCTKSIKLKIKLLKT